MTNIQQIPIWIFLKSLNCNHSLETIWWYQTGYEMQWSNNCCFYWLFKGFWYYRLLYLIQKMHSLNLSTDVLYWVFKYLTQRQHFVQMNSFLTAKYGMPQGSIFGSILFNLCATVMSSITPNRNCIKYVDDSTIYIEAVKSIKKMLV